MLAVLRLYLASVYEAGVNGDFSNEVGVLYTSSCIRSKHKSVVKFWEPILE